MTAYKKNEAQEWGPGNVEGPVDHPHDPLHGGRRGGRRRAAAQYPPRQKTGHQGRRLHLGHGRVLEPDPRRTGPGDGHLGRRGRRAVAHRRPRDPLLGAGDVVLGQTRRGHRLRRAHRCPALHRGQDRRPSSGVRPAFGRQHIPGRHVLQLAPIRYRHGPRRPGALVPHTQRGRRQGGQLQPSPLHRNPLAAGQGPRHQHPRRVDILEGQGVGISTASNVLQYLRLAVRRPRQQQLRAVHRPGDGRPLGRGVLRIQAAPH